VREDVHEDEHGLTSTLCVSEGAIVLSLISFLYLWLVFCFVVVVLLMVVSCLTCRILYRSGVWNLAGNGNPVVGFLE
jgi:hypothetical protein